MRNSFLLKAGDGENIPILWAAEVLLLLWLNNETDSSGTAYIPLKYLSGSQLCMGWIKSWVVYI